MFIFKQFFDGLPRDLEEAARVDGAGFFRIYRRIVMPLSRPAVAAVAIFTFVWTWNNLLWPLLVLTNPKLMTIPVGLATVQGSFGIRYADTMASAILGALPLVRSSCSSSATSSRASRAPASRAEEARHEATPAASAPAQLRRDVPDDAVQQVRVVVDAELVRDRQQQRVRGGDRLVLGELLDELVGLPGIRLAEPGRAAVDEADLVLAARLRAEVRAVECC